MSFFTRYLQILLGGPLTISRNKLEPGHIVSFRYRSEASNRKLNRIALVLGKFNKGNGMMIHALNIENIPPEKLYLFLKRVIIKDTLSLIKRKYEIKGPFSQLIDRPRSFYIKYIKPNLLEFDCYRTYKLHEIKNSKCYMLDWKKLRLYDNSTHKLALVSKEETLVGIERGKKLLNEVLRVDISSLNNAKFKQIVNERFGGMSSFYEMLGDIENFTESPNTDDNEFDASKS